MALASVYAICPGPLYQNEVKCSTFDMKMIFHSLANKTYFHKKGCALGLILKARVFGTLKLPILLPSYLLYFSSAIYAVEFIHAFSTCISDA